MKHTCHAYGCKVAVPPKGTVAAAEPVTGLSASEVSRWRRRGVLSKAGE